MSTEVQEVNGSRRFVRCDRSITWNRLHERAPMPAFLCDGEGRVIDSNPAMRSLCGWPPDETGLGTELDVLLTFPGLARAIVSEVRTAGSWRGKVVINRNDGMTTDVLMMLARVDADEEPAGLLSGALIDVGERIRVEDALLASEAAMRTLVAANPDAFCLLDRHGDILAANHRASEDLGVALDSLVTRHWLALLDPDEIEVLSPHLDLARAHGGEVHCESNHGGRFFDYRLCPILGNDTEVENVAVFWTDITERRTAEVALREVSGMLATLVEASPLPIVAVDGRSIVTLWNHAAESMFGVPADFAVGHSAPVLAENGRLERLLAGETIAGEEISFNRPEGPRLNLLMYAAPLYDRLGAVVGAMAVFDDVSERNRLQQRLWQTQKMDALGRVAGGAAHGLANLLQGVLSRANVIRDLRHEPERLALLAEDLTHEAERGAALVRQLSLFARRGSAHRELVNLDVLVAESVPLLRAAMPPAIRLTWEPSAATATVEVDRAQLQQSLVNLVANSIEATPDAGGIVIRTGASDHTAWLEVEDSGCGIRPDSRPLIFDPFFTTKPGGRNAGLGLSVVHGIVTGHGGTVTVDTEVGRGSTFRITLPTAAPCWETPALQADETRRVASHRGQGELLLLVEDEPGSREGLAQALIQLGYRVTAVGSAEEALEQPPEPPFSLLLTDLGLPGLGGSELAQALRRRWIGLRVVFMSGYSEAEMAARGVATDRDIFLEKPFDLHVLGRALRSAVDRGSSDAEPSSSEWH